MNYTLFVLLILQITSAYSSSNGRYNNVLLRNSVSARMKRMQKSASVKVDCLFNICEHVPDYPEKEVENIINEHKALHSFFGGSIIEPGDIAVTTRMREEQWTPFCKTIDMSAVPRQMDDIDNVKRDIANVKNHSQVLKYQICSYEHKDSCYPGNTLDFKTACVQKFNIIKLITVNVENKALEYRKFRIPSTCVCEYTKP